MGKQAARAHPATGAARARQILASIGYPCLPPFKSRFFGEGQALTRESATMMETVKDHHESENIRVEPRSIIIMETRSVKSLASFEQSASAWFSLLECRNSL